MANLTQTTETPKLKIKAPIHSVEYAEKEIDLPYYFKSKVVDTLFKIESEARVITVHLRDDNGYNGISFYPARVLSDKDISEGVNITAEEFETAKELVKAKIAAL